MAKWRRADRLYIDLPLARPGSLNAYLIAALFAGLAALARVALEPWMEGVQFITFYPAIILAALLCGVGAGILCVLLSAAAAWYLVRRPSNLLDIQVEAAVPLALFLFIGLLIVLVIGAMRKAVARYRELSFTLHRRVEQRTAELRSAEASLVQAQKIEALGQLTGGIAHDFNNMLAVVLGNLEIAQRRLAAGKDVERQIGNAAEGARRAASLTQRLLAFSRRQPLAPELTDVNRLIAELIELLRRTLGESVRVEWAPASGLRPVRVDRAQLESALVNLAVNARDAMDGGGRLTIATAALEGHEGGGNLASGDYVEIEVTDTGCGMDEEIAARALEPFFTTKEIGRGTGLGLSQVYGFIRQSGGDLSIESRPGEGTSVRLFLPARDGGVEAESAVRPTGEALPRGRPGEVVLVVEDEDQVRRTSVESLVELGYGVREARSGLEALAILASDPSIDLMFTDVVMPGLDGRQLAVRALRQRPDLRILYTSGYTREGGPSGGGGEEVEAELLPKPFTLEELAREVRAALDS